MNPKELIEILENKLEQMPGNQELKEQLAFLLLSQGDLNRAETLFSDVIKTNPAAPDSIWGLAKLSWQKRSYDVAYSYMNLLASMPNASLNKEQALIFAKILAKKDHFIEASKWLDTAIAQDSSLLQSEMPFLKLIKHNLVLRNLDNTKGQTGSPMNGQMMDHLMPHNSNSPSSPIGRHVHYIVLEISQLLAPYQGLGYPNPMSAPGSFDDGTENIIFEEEPEKEDLNQTKKLITFDQIGGLKKVKQALIQEIIIPLKNPQLCTAYNKSTNPKVLLYGPPGCGKTYLCRALATEAEINFFAIRPADFIDLSYEESEIRLSHLLQQIRDMRPAVILFDEIDWLAEKPQKGNNSDETLSNQAFKANLLSNILDFINTQSKLNNQIGLIATTNKPWNLDHSFFSSAKINKHIFVGPPNREDKVDILRIALETRQSPVIVPSKIDCAKVIDCLPRLSSGADIEDLVDSALTELLVETIVNLQISNSEVNPNILLAEHLIKAGKRQKTIPSVKLWISQSRQNLSLPSHPLNGIWRNILENLILSENSENKAKAQRFVSTIKSSIQKFFQGFKENFIKSKTEIDCITDLDVVGQPIKDESKSKKSENKKLVNNKKKKDKSQSV